MSDAHHSENPPPENSFPSPFEFHPQDVSSTPLDAASAPVMTAQPVEDTANNKLSFMARCFGFLVPFSLFISVVLLVLYVTPWLLVRWRIMEAEAEREATYMKRRAELKAEMEASQERLKFLNTRTQLVSLGFRDVVRVVTPKVVNVSSYVEVSAEKAAQFHKRAVIFDDEKNKYYLSTGVGSGLIAKPGYILTNHHVVAKAQRLRVTFASGQSVNVPSSDVAADPITDLAVITLPDTTSPGLSEDYNQAVTFANSDKVEPGDLVLAMGSPLGLKYSVSQGIISAKGRLLKMLDMVELLQTDTAINPGNSGGPLFDQLGRVIGVNVAIASETGVNQGIGFAIPSNTVKRIFNQLVKKGEVARGFIGIGIESVSEDRAKEIGLERQGGVLITHVVPNFPAERAGLQVGDIIIHFSGKPFPIADANGYFRQRVLESDVGSHVPLEIYRNGQRQIVRLEITRRNTRLR